MPSFKDQPALLLELSVPGKTFLLGEYLALRGGPSIILTTAPRFQLKVSRGAASLPFHPESPAGKFLATQADILSGLELKFHDAHHGLGGLGGSTAEFALSYALLQMLKDNSSAEPVLNPQSILQTYQEFAWGGHGQAPSGADLIAQLSGGVCYFDGLTYDVRDLAWPFAELDWTLIRTGHKLATHLHLGEMAKSDKEVQSLTSDFEQDFLRGLVKNATTAFAEGDAPALCQSVNEYAKILDECGLTVATTKILLQDLRASQVELGIQALKGCGAGGADIICVLHKPETRGALEAWLGERGLVIAGRLSDLSTGLEVKQRSRLS
jgi:mevalonate kinase